MPLSSTEIGRRIEGWAREWFLRHEGGRFLERNFRCRSGEVDLIFEVNGPQGVELVFVEVRGRGERGWVGPVESVTFPKQLRLSRAIRTYLARYGGPAKCVRLDLLGWDGTRWIHVRNVWPIPGMR